MTTPKPKHCRVYSTGIPIYRGFLYLVLGRDEDAITNARAEFTGVFGKCQFDWDGGGAMCSFKHSDVGLFFHQKFLTPGCIAHEVLHAVARIMDQANAKFDPDNCEPYTYLAEWITEWVWTQIGKSIRPEKR